MSFKVVSTATVDYPVRNLAERIRVLDGVEFSSKPSPSEDDIIAVAGDADAVITATEPFTKRVIASLKSCRLITTPKTGYDNIDVAAATEAGICVSCVAEASTEEVADHAMALLLACARKVARLDRAIRAGEWKVFHGPDMERIWKGMVPLRGQTLGLVSFGRIPRALVPKAAGFGMKILAYDPYVESEAMEKMGVEKVGLDRLLKESDFVSVHAALTGENRHMLGADQFEMMKPSAYIINAARGPLVDEKALYTALANGGIAGAGLDVFEEEPIKMDNPLLGLDNVILTGHSAHYSDISVNTARRNPVEDISGIMSGKWPVGWVNPDVEAKYTARWGDMRRK